MKKFLIFINLFIFTFFIAAQGVKVEAAVITKNLEFIYYDNEAYDLETGVRYDDINYSITNRISIGLEAINDEITVNSELFHHVLFFDNYNTYMGYINTASSTLQLDSYLGYDVEDFQFIAPEKARSFALMSYNYEDTRSQIAYTYPSIDDIAWESLTYRDIFEGTNLTLNPYFDNVSNVDGIVSNCTAADSVVISGGQLDAVWTFDVGTSCTYYKPNLTTGDVYFYSITHTVENVDAINGGEGVMKIYNWSGAGSSNLEYMSFVEAVPKTFRTIFDTADHNIDFENDDYGFIFYIYGDNDSIVESFTLTTDDNLLYNLSSIGFTSYPTPDDFEDMRLYYERYKDVSGGTLTYSQIYGTNSRYGGSNNLIENGDFSNNFTSWNIIDSLGEYTIVNGKLVYISTGVTPNPIMRQFGIINIADLHYLTYEILSNNGATSYRWSQYHFNSGSFNTFHFYGDILELRGDFTSIDFGFVPSQISGSYSLDNFRLYSYTNIFGPTADDIPIEDFESWYEVWDDPYFYDYVEYYPVAPFLTLQLSYEYDDTPAPDPDATDSINAKLTSIGVGGNPVMEILLAIGAMIALAVIIGKKTNNIVILVLTEVVALFVFTLLGWIKLWVILLLVLVVALLTLSKVLKGGD